MAQYAPHSDQGARSIEGRHVVATPNIREDSRALAVSDFQGYQGYSESDSDSEEEEEEEKAPRTSQQKLTGAGFQMLSGAVILLCMISMSFETNYPEMWWWGLVNNMFLLFFIFELAITFSTHTCGEFFCGEERAWNNFDFWIVMFCIADQWIITPVAQQSASVGGQNTLASSGSLKVVRVLRVVRILRILRVVRIFKMCTQLNDLAVGLFESMQTVSWIMALLFMFMSIFAIFLTSVAGTQTLKPGDTFWEPEKLRIQVREHFGSVELTLVTLFQFLTLDDWSNITRLVADRIPVMWIVFIVYVVMMSLAMLSLLTGVIADKMTEVSEESKSEEEDQENEEIAKLVMEVREEHRQKYRGAKDGFTKADMTRMLQETDEFGKSRLSQLNELKIKVAGHEVEDFWGHMDRHNKGQLSWKELEAGLLRLKKDPEPKDMLRIRYSAERIALRLQGGQGEAASKLKIEEVKELMADSQTRINNMEKELQGFLEFLHVSESMGSLGRITHKISQGVI